MSQKYRPMTAADRSTLLLGNVCPALGTTANRNASLLADRIRRCMWRVCKKSSLPIPKQDNSVHAVHTHMPKKDGQS
jgi:hypothetical protein